MPAQATVFIPNFNGGRYIKRALESLAAQTYSDFAVLVIDDGSTDNSLEIAETFTDILPNLRILRFENSGIAAAWNRAFDLVETPYLTLLHCDDEYHPDYIAKMSSLMDAHPQAAIGHCAALAMDQQSKVLDSPMEVFKFNSFFKNAPAVREPIEDYKLLLKGCFINCPSVIYRTESAKQVGLFNPHYKTTLDWEYWFRVLFLGFSIASTPEQLFFYRRHGENESQKTSENLSRFHEEHDVIQWAHGQGQQLGWLPEDVQPDYGLLNQTMTFAIANDLLRNSRKAAGEKHQLLRMLNPRVRHRPLNIGLYVFRAMGPLGGWLLNRAILTAVRLAKYW